VALYLDYSYAAHNTPRQLSHKRKTHMNKPAYILALLFAVIFSGCQVAYVKPAKGEMAGDVTVYQGFSRSAVGAQNTLDAATTKTSEFLTADVSPELSSEINPSISSEINPALASEINPSLAGNSAEITPEVSTELAADVSPEISPELEVSDLSDVATGGAEPIEEEEAEEVVEDE